MPMWCVINASLGTFYVQRVSRRLAGWPRYGTLWKNTIDSISSENRWNRVCSAKALLTRIALSYVYLWDRWNVLHKFVYWMWVLMNKFEYVSTNNTKQKNLWNCSTFVSYHKICVISSINWIRFCISSFNPTPQVRMSFWSTIIGNFFVGLTSWGPSQFAVQRYSTLSSVKKVKQ